MKYIFSIVLILVIFTVYFILRPEPTFEVGKTTDTPLVHQDEPFNDEINKDDSMIESKRIAMQTEFDNLELARRNLESRLNRLKVIFWGKEIPRDKNLEITREMKNGYALLKDKKLLGAYSDVSEITHELSKIEYIDNYLQKIEEEYRSKRLQ